MKLQKSVVLTLLLCLFCFSFLSACGKKVNKVDTETPSIFISGNYKWKHIDTSLCRLYYYQDENFIKSIAEDFNNIYKEVCDKLKHSSRPNSKEDGKVLFFFLDDHHYKSYTKDMSAGANWRQDGGFINLSKKDSPSILSTFRHELIHAVTLYSEDTELKNCPGWFADGIAQYYQNGVNKGTYSKSVIKEAVEKNMLVAWDTLIPSSGNWGNNDRPLKYYQSACIYEYLIQEYEEDRINNVFYTNGNFNDVIKDITNKTIKELEKDWLEHISNRFN